MLHTLNDVHDGWARVLCGDGLALMKFSESRHQVMRCVGRSAFIKPVDLDVIIVFMRTALESSLRNFDVLYISCVSTSYTWQ